MVHPSLSARRARALGRCHGFTLVEMLTVIAIIGILAAIVIPTMDSFQKKAQRAVDGSNLRQILQAAQIYAQSNQDRLPDPQPNVTPNAVLTATQLTWKWPGILAKYNILNDPTFFFAKGDPAFNGTYPQFIIQPTAARNTLHTSFTTGRSPSWEFVGGVKVTDNPMTPVIYTRGLQANGSWSATSGVYGDQGGFIAFLGGNVAFYSSTSPATNPPGVFVTNNPTSTSQTRPTDVRQAVPFNVATPANSARIYGIPPAAGAGGMLGTANGSLAVRGP